MEEALLSIKNQIDDFEVEYEVVSQTDVNNKQTAYQKEIQDSVEEVDALLKKNFSEIDCLSQEIDRLTNHADKLDYIVAVGSGMLTAAIDVFWVGEFSFARGSQWGSDAVNHFVTKIAKKQGYNGNDLEGAIRFMEDKYPSPSDSVTSAFGGGKQHHLRDFAHHPTPVGLLFSFLTQFTGKAYGTDAFGGFIVVDVKNTTLIGHDFPSKILFGVVNWFFHMVSDMAGTVTNPGMGTGLPGPLLSLLKELSVLPFFKNIKVGDKEFSLWLSKLFNGTLFAKRDESGRIIQETVHQFDLRAELGIVHEIGRQAVPIIINECIVRGFYFIRRFAMEIRKHNIKKISDLNQIDWKNTVPFGNRTIARMVTIASGTFTAIDMAVAAIQSAVKSGGAAPAFLSNFVLKINFVGIGRFAVAVVTDVRMGVKREKLKRDRIALYSEQMALMNAKMFYKSADMWIAAQDTGECIRELYETMEESIRKFSEYWNDICEDMSKIGNHVEQVKIKNPELADKMLEILEWG